MLRPKFRITNRMNNALLDIERARGFLEAAKLKEDWVKGMQSQAILLESHHSTHIEGTQLTLPEAQRLLQGKPVKGVRKVDRQELLNYREAMESLTGRMDDSTTISEDLIKDLHRTIVKDVRGGAYSPGIFRLVQNYVVNSRTGEVIYTPPPPTDVPSLMAELVNWLNAPKEMSPVLAAGICQYQFVAIHSFMDGNGRTARVLCTLVLYRGGYDFKRLFSLSEFYDKGRRAYYDAIQSVRENDGDLTSWLEYFTAGLRGQLVELKEKGERAIRRDVLLERAVRAGLNDRQRRILTHLMDVGKASVGDVQTHLGLVRRTVQRDLLKMTVLGLVRERAASRTDPTRYYELL